jgi:RNA polymerase sigma factor, sigma-70 family
LRRIFPLILCVAKKPSVSLDAEIPGTEGLALNTLLPGNSVPPDEQIVKTETEQWIQREIGVLPDKYRSAVVLKYVEDLSLKEISEIMGLPVGTVKTRVHRGREMLRRNMKESRGEKDDVHE